MITAVDSIAAFVAGRSRADLDTDSTLHFPLVRAIEIVGAAPTGPWAKLTAMRNRLIHACFDIDHDVLWRTAIKEFPALLPRLRSLATDE
jgi:uncharacterized protein with HEPN domain